MEALESRLLSIRSEFHYHAILDSSASITALSEVEASKLYEKIFLARRYRCKVERLQIKDFFKNVRRGKPRINGFVNTKNEE